MAAVNYCCKCSYLLRYTSVRLKIKILNISFPCIESYAVVLKIRLKNKNQNKFRLKKLRKNCSPRERNLYIIVPNRTRARNSCSCVTSRSYGLKRDERTRKNHPASVYRTARGCSMLGYFRIRRDVRRHRRRLRFFDVTKAKRVEEGGYMAG